MPLPVPRKSEKEQQFISRCMGNDTMNKDYPEQSQRAAVCFKQWRKSKAKENKGENMDSDKTIEEKRDEQGRLIIAENVNLIIGATIGERKND